MQKQILFIDNDREYAEIVAKVLRDEGYYVQHVSCSVDALNAVKEVEYDLVITDMTLDNFNGLQMTELIRRASPFMPVMILTDSVKEEDELQALDIGLNDYVKKSVSFNILLGRIKHIFAMQSEPEFISEKLVSRKEQLVVELDSRLVTKYDVEVHLTVTEYDLLVFFLIHRNKIFSREDILKEVWKIEKLTTTVDERIVDSFVRNLRSKLDISSIYSIRGIGYRWHE